MVPDRGHGDHWRVVAAVVGCLALSSAGEAAGPSFQGNRGYPEQTNSHREQNDSALTVLLPAVEAVEQIESKEYNHPCAEGEDNRSSDLCAQWKAADSASD